MSRCVVVQGALRVFYTYPVVNIEVLCFSAVLMNGVGIVALLLAVGSPANSSMDSSRDGDAHDLGKWACASAPRYRLLPQVLPAIDARSPSGPTVKRPAAAVSRSEWSRRRS